MFHTFTNLFHVLRRYRVASLLNLAGLAIAFAAFLLIVMYARREYTFDAYHPQKESIFQPEIRRTDGIWDSNFSRPHLERIFASSPHILAGGTCRGAAYSNVARVSVSAKEGAGETGMTHGFEWITPEFTEVFHFDMLEGTTEALRNPDVVLIPESFARKLFGDGSALGKALYICELEGMGDRVELTNGLVISLTNTIGGVYKDFPENSRISNAVYCSIRPQDMMQDWWTGCFYGYVLLDSPDAAEEVVRRYNEESADLFRRLAVTEFRLRPLEELYFGEHVRGDASPAGNKMVTDILLLVALLIVVISSFNFINFSIALAPLRVRNINTRKILGCSVRSLRQSLVLESVLISLLAYGIALILVWGVQQGNGLQGLLGAAVSLGSNGDILWATAAFAVFTGWVAGIWPARYLTSFSPALALNGTFALTAKTRFIRKFLVGCQYVVSFLLIICALFIHLQNRYLQRVNLGFDKENILEVKLSFRAALTQSDLFRQKVLEHPGILDVAFTQNQFVHDETKPFIGYFFKGEHLYQYWSRVSWNFPEMMGLTLRAGRYFREGDQERSEAKTVCMISALNAKEMGAAPGDVLMDDGNPVEIIGVFDDIRFESLFEPVKPIGLWIASDKYDRSEILNYAYLKLIPGDPAAAIEHVYGVLQDVDPVNPPSVRFFDERLNDLYDKSRNEGLLVTLFCLIAVLLSIVGVFGLVVFETQGRTKEIAVRKVMGSTTAKILWMFNASFVRIVLICFGIAIVPAIGLMRLWLRAFTERISLQPWVFGVALLLLSGLTILTVTFQSYRAATANPSDSLQKG